MQIDGTIRLCFLRIAIVGYLRAGCDGWEDVIKADLLLSLFPHSAAAIHFSFKNAFPPVQTCPATYPEPFNAFLKLRFGVKSMQSGESFVSEDNFTFSIR